MGQSRVEFEHRPGSAAHWGSFWSGRPTSRAFRIELLAEVEVAAALVHLRSLAIYPVGTEQADIGVAELLRAARAGLFPALRAAGFTRLRVSAIRLSGSLPGRIVDLTIDLERQAR